MPLFNKTDNIAPLGRELNSIVSIFTTQAQRLGDLIKNCKSQQEEMEYQVSDLKERMLQVNELSNQAATIQNNINALLGEDPASPKSLDDIGV